jgi:predicted HAD superfamily Cof-like phosphohydrolase
MQDNPILRIRVWFDTARPVPNDNIIHTQVGVHFEEVSEMLAEMTGLDGETRVLIEKAKQANHNLAEHLKANDDVLVIDSNDRKSYLDALCDQIVTAIGCAQAEGMNIVDALAEVDRSNWSKFVNGKAIYDANGKIAKGPNYFKVELAPFI